MTHQLTLKEQNLLEIFQNLPNDAKYMKIIELGKNLPPFPPEDKKGENLVKGCQSTMYLSSQLVEEKLLFNVHSDALISKGLAAILIYLYNNEPASSLFLFPPKVLDSLDLLSSLSMTRQNGLKSLYQMMQKKASAYI